MARRLFSEISPLTYKISVKRQQLQRNAIDAMVRQSFAKQGTGESLGIKVYSHNSLIRRRLGNTHPELQEGKARSLSLAAPHVDGVVIAPGETFSFWRLVGEPPQRKGYLPGLMIEGDHAAVGVGGGLCQFTNLLHWMTLHSSLTIVEHHHHSGLDLFPDFQRQIPFGTGTSIVWNFLDYRVRNDTDQTFQFRVRVDDEYLRGELCSDQALPMKYHIREEDAYFYRAADPRTAASTVRRHNVVMRDTRDKRTGNIVKTERPLENDALACYDPDMIRDEILPEKPSV
ncbi:VanW family protein [Kocuria sp. JC486]|nr:VanW family protein [Kocuria sp. JC486]